MQCHPPFRSHALSESYFGHQPHEKTTKGLRDSYGDKIWWVDSCKHEEIFQKVEVAQSARTNTGFSIKESRYLICFDYAVGSTLTKYASDVFASVHLLPGTLPRWPSNSHKRSIVSIKVNGRSGQTWIRYIISVSQASTFLDPKTGISPGRWCNYLALSLWMTYYLFEQLSSNNRMQHGLPKWFIGPSVRVKDLRAATIRILRNIS